MESYTFNSHVNLLVPGGGFLPSSVMFVLSVLAPIRTDLCEIVEAISSV